MKKIFYWVAVAALGFTGSVASAHEMNLACVTEFPTTSFVFSEDAGYVDVRVISHNGVNFTPIWKGLITPHDIPIIAQQAETMKKLGSDFTLRFSLKNCETYEKNNFFCIGKGPAKDINGLQVEPSTVSVTDIEKRVFGMVFKSKNATLNLKVNGVEHTATMDFEANDCFNYTEPFEI